MSSRSEKDRYLPDTGASSIGGIPPACRNHRDPTGADTPHATAASSLVSPAAICTQNARSRSRRTGGRPGDRITARPVNAAAQPGGRPIESTSISEVLRPPVEPGLCPGCAIERQLLIRNVEKAAVGGQSEAIARWLTKNDPGVRWPQTGSNYRPVPLRSGSPPAASCRRGFVSRMQAQQRSRVSTRRIL